MVRYFTTRCHSWCVRRALSLMLCRGGSWLRCFSSISWWWPQQCTTFTTPQYELGAGVPLCGSGTNRATCHTNKTYKLTTNTRSNNTNSNGNGNNCTKTGALYSVSYFHSVSSKKKEKKLPLRTKRLRCSLNWQSRSSAVVQLLTTSLRGVRIASDDVIGWALRFACSFVPPELRSASVLLLTDVAPRTLPALRLAVWSAASWSFKCQVADLKMPKKIWHLSIAYQSHQIDRFSHKSTTGTKKVLVLEAPAHAESERANDTERERVEAHERKRARITLSHSASASASFSVSMCLLEKLDRTKLEQQQKQQKLRRKLH